MRAAERYATPMQAFKLDQNSANTVLRQKARSLSQQEVLLEVPGRVSVETCGLTKISFDVDALTASDDSAALKPGVCPRADINAFVTVDNSQ